MESSEATDGANTYPSSRPERDRRRRLRNANYEAARSSHAGEATFSFLARSAIRLAVNKEPDPGIRQRRRDMLLRRWRSYVTELRLLPYMRMALPPWWRW